MMGSTMKLTMHVVPSTPERRIHIKASSASSLHPAARPISPKTGAPIGSM
jgi:hypothetical protein